MMAKFLVGVPMVAALQGEEIHCIGNHAHLVTYDVTGDSLATLSDASIAVRPSPEANAQCTDDPSHGDKPICVGANIDETCSTSVADVPINNVLDCQNCFAGAATDLYYTLNISAFRLRGVEVGLRGNHLRGAVEIHGQDQASGPIAQGAIDIVDASKVAKIHFTVAKFVPVDITIGMPTSLEYNIGWDGELDAVAGADIDIDLGDHFFTWSDAGGFVYHNTSTAINATPVLNWNSGAADVNVGLDLKSSLQIDIDHVMWYHFNMKPSIPTKVGLSHQAGQQDMLCGVTDVDFDINHEADVHFTLFGKRDQIYHFGPEELYHYHKAQALKKCVDVPIQEDIAV